MVALYSVPSQTHRGKWHRNATCCVPRPQFYPSQISKHSNSFDESSKWTSRLLEVLSSFCHCIRYVKWFPYSSLKFFFLYCRSSTSTAECWPPSVVKAQTRVSLNSQGKTIQRVSGLLSFNHINSAHFALSSRIYSGHGNSFWEKLENSIFPRVLFIFSSTWNWLKTAAPFSFLQ